MTWAAEQSINTFVMPNAHLPIVYLSLSWQPPALRCIKLLAFFDWIGLVHFQIEVKELTACVQSTSAGGDSKSFIKKIKYYLTAKEFLTPMGIMIFMSMVQGSCGVDTISYYSLKIFRLARVALDEYLMAILLQVPNLNYIHTILNDLFGNTFRFTLMSPKN